VTKGDLYTATVYSPVVGQPHGGCPVYANMPMTCVRLRNLPQGVHEKDIFSFFYGLQVRADVHGWERDGLVCPCDVTWLQRCGVRLQVIGLYICRDFQGRCTGEAYAEFGGLEDCQQAMSRNRCCDAKACRPMGAAVDWR
jgi:hypothetical protein